MPRYQVRAGEVLPVNGELLAAGSCLDLPQEVADDTANRHLLQEVDAATHPLTAMAIADDDLARYRAHERVSILRARLAVLESDAAQIRQRITDEDQRILDDITARRTAPAPTPVPAKPKPSPSDPATNVKE